MGKSHSNMYYRAGICQHEQIQQTRILNRVLVRKFLKITLPLALISALAVASFQVQSFHNEVGDLRALGAASVRANSESIRKDFIDASADLRVLADSSSLKKVLESGGPQAIGNAARDFLAFVAFKKNTTRSGTSTPKEWR